MRPKETSDTRRAVESFRETIERVKKEAAQDNQRPWYQPAPPSFLRYTSSTSPGIVYTAANLGLTTGATESS